MQTFYHRARWKEPRRMRSSSLTSGIYLGHLSWGLARFLRHHDLPQKQCLRFQITFGPWTCREHLEYRPIAAVLATLQNHTRDQPNLQVCTAVPNCKLSKNKLTTKQSRIEMKRRGKGGGGVLTVISLPSYMLLSKRSMASSASRASRNSTNPKPLDRLRSTQISTTVTVSVTVTATGYIGIQSV